MTPNSKTHDDTVLETELEKLVAPQAAPRKFEIVYFNLLTFGYTHVAAIYGLYLCFTAALWKTILFNVIVVIIAEFGVTVGAHRLWAHKSFKAKLPLQIILMIFHSMTNQNTVTDFVRDHRLHHKYSDTDADPHNAARGFFYSHVGWLLVRKHPEVSRRGKFTEMSDIYNNPVLKFQKKYARPLIGTVCFFLPTFIPIYFWGESINNAWHLCMLRYATNLNITFMVNSLAHINGTRTYDKRILPAYHFFGNLLTLGEGHHNFHHVFPNDYRSSELGIDLVNVNTALIDFFAWIGWAYDLKTVPSEVIKARAKRTGDGSYLERYDVKNM